MRLAIRSEAVWRVPRGPVMMSPAVFLGPKVTLHHLKIGVTASAPVPTQMDRVIRIPETQSTAHEEPREGRCPNCHVPPQPVTTGDTGGATFGLLHLPGRLRRRCRRTPTLWRVQRGSQGSSAGCSNCTPNTVTPRVSQTTVISIPDTARDWAIQWQQPSASRRR